DRLRPVVRQGPVPGRADQFPICPGAGDRLHLHRRCRTARLRRWIGGPVGVHDPDLEDPGHRLQCSGPFRSLDRGRCRLDVRVPRLHQHRHDDGDHPRHGSPAALLEPGRFGVPRPHLRPGGGEFHLAASLARPRRALRGLRVESRDRTRTRAETSDDREDADRVVGRTGEEAHLAVRSATYHLPLTTYHLPPTTYHLPPTTYHLPLTTYHPPTARRSTPHYAPGHDVAPRGSGMARSHLRTHVLRQERRVDSARDARRHRPSTRASLQARYRRPLRHDRERPSLSPVPVRHPRGRL